MKLEVLGSGSNGNSYLLRNENEILILDAGISTKEVKIAIDFSIYKVQGVLVSHEHSDHYRYANDWYKMGIPVNRAFLEKKNKPVEYGKFFIQAFPLVHNVENRGFLIHHPECGKVLYITDTEYCKFRFKAINHFLIECNYLDEYVDEHAENRSHVIRGHQSLQTCIEFLKANVSEDTKTITLCHLSMTNGNPELFKEMVQKEFPKVVVNVAKKGLTVDL